MPLNISTSLPRSADCVIIGGGVIGAATAYFAARAGLKCLVLEKRPALCTLTTPAAGGAFRLQFDNPEELALVRESVEFFQNFQHEIKRSGYDLALRQQGYLFLTTTSAGAERQRKLVEAQHTWGLKDAELLSGDEARVRFPYLAPEIVSARFRQGDGWLDPRQLTMGYAAASGATFCVDTAVTGFEISSGAVKSVKTNRGSISCGSALIAAGPFSGEVAKMAGLDLKFDLRMRQRMIMPEVPEVPHNAPMTIDENTGAHWKPCGPWNSSRPGGAHVLFTQHDSPSGPPLENVPPDTLGYFNLLHPKSPNSVARIAPFWKKVWQRNTDHYFFIAGQYTYTPDHRPFLGPSPIAGLFLNCGYSGHGIMGSAGGSRIAVDTITAKLAAKDNPFRLDRKIEKRVLDVL